MAVNTRDQYDLYFVRPVGMIGPIKIGLSINAGKRMKDCNTWSPFPLEIVGSVPGRWEDEQFLHECLGEHHSHGEWFHPAPPVLRAMEMVLSDGNLGAVRAAFVPVLNVRSKKNRMTRALRKQEERAA